MIHYTDIIKGNNILEKYYFHELDKRDYNLQIEYYLEHKHTDIIGFVITLNNKIYPIIRIDNMICCDIDMYGNRKGLFYDQEHINRDQFNTNIVILIKQIIYEINTFIINKEEDFGKLITAYFIADKYEPKDYVCTNMGVDL